MSCTACGYYGAPPPAAARALHEAGLALARLDVEARQLDAAQRAALTGGVGCGPALLRLFGRAVLLSLAGFSALALLAAAWMALDGEFTIAGVTALFFVPILLMSLGAAWLSVRWQRQGMAKLRAACTASAPLEAGAPATCRLCGAPLPVQHATAAIARCVHCRADNFVSVAALALPVARRIWSLDQLEASVLTEQRALRALPARELQRSVQVAVVAPMVAFAVVFAAALVVVSVRHPPDLQARYVAITRDGRTCIGRWNPAKPGQANFGGSEPGFGLGLDITPAEARPFAVDALVGRTLRTREHVFVVRAVHADLSGTNWLDSGEGSSFLVNQCCMAPEGAAPNTASAAPHELQREAGDGVHDGEPPTPAR